MLAIDLLSGLVLLPVLVFGVPLNHIRQYDDGNATTSNFTRLIVFGDSYSDDGNGSWIVSNETWPADPAYYGHHFSNGPTWAQDMAEDLGLELLDLAVGGATSDNDFVHGYTGYYSNISVPSTADQIVSYLANNNDSFLPTDIVVLYIGTNDVTFNLSITALETLSIITSQIYTLYEAGASTILLGTYPVMNTFPAYDSLPSNVSTQEILIDYSYNFTAGLDILAATWSNLDVNIAVADVQGLFWELYANPEKHGINASYVNPSVACLYGTYPDSGERSLCNDVDQHVFFDTYHPTARVHQMIAEEFEYALSIASTGTDGFNATGNSV